MTLVAKSANSVKIGKVFEAGRIKAGLSKNEVAKASIMNIKYIEAIESGDYSIFPSKSFARAYFIKYQDFLSLSCDFPSIYDENLRESEIIEKSITKLNSSLTPNIKKGAVILAVFIILFILSKSFFFNQIDIEDVSKSTVDDIKNTDIKEIPINTNLKVTDNLIDSIELYEED
jgi:cytoskeletal protein RodZ